MKTMMAAFLLSFGLFSQNTTIQLELVTPNVGTAYYDPMLMQCGNTSNDAGLTTIFAAHNVLRYCPTEFLSYPELIYSYGGLVECSGCDANAFISDLEAYDVVVRRARLTPGPEFFANYLGVRFNPSVSQTGTTANDVIVTNNPALNEIFQNLTVFYFSDVAGIYADLQCDCYAPDLADALVDSGFVEPNPVDPDTGGMIYENYFYHQMAYLGNPAFASDKTMVSPNPYCNTIRIDCDADSAYYTLFTLAGQLITRSYSRLAVEDVAIGLEPGLYLLTIQHASGNSQTFKLVKK